jgi:hypothetical protein
VRDSKIRLNQTGEPVCQERGVAPRLEDVRIEAGEAAGIRSREKFIGSRLRDVCPDSASLLSDYRRASCRTIAAPCSC